jgi:hypothetical protein
MLITAVLNEIVHYYFFKWGYRSYMNTDNAVWREINDRKTLRKHLSFYSKPHVLSKRATEHSPEVGSTPTQGQTANLPPQKNRVSSATQFIKAIVEVNLSYPE